MFIRDVTGERDLSLDGVSGEIQLRGWLKYWFTSNLGDFRSSSVGPYSESVVIKADYLYPLYP
jgi:hypothetical protein